MRLVSALLFVALTGSTALADEAKPADPKPEVAKSRVPLRVVRMLPETRQVLLLDRIRGSHVVAEVGQEVEGYIVDEILDDEVTLVAPSGAEVILAAPDMSWRRRAAERKAAAAKAAHPADATAAAGDAAPAMADGPSADAAPAGSPAATATASAATASAATGSTAAGPVDPYADSAEPASPAATAPAAAPAAQPPTELDPGIAAFVEAVGATPVPTPAPAPATPAPTATPPASAAPSPALPPPPVAAPAPAAPANSFTIARGDVDAALSDFGATAVTFDARFVADGLRIDSIAEGTILAKAGLRKGDTITAVDGKPLRSFDDAADLYARLGTARAATIAIVRGGKPMTLRVAIR